MSGEPNSQIFGQLQHLPADAPFKIREAALIVNISFYRDARGLNSMAPSEIDDVSNRISRFKTDLVRMTDPEVVHLHITQGDCYALDRRHHTLLSFEVARHFGIHPNEVVIVGSGRLGFSISPKKRWRHFGNQSDIDLAIVSPELFDQIWIELFEKWSSGLAPWTEEEQFKKYLFRGWIRPDKLPDGLAFRRRSEWFEFFRRVTRSGRYGRYQIRGGLYRNWSFLQAYQSQSVKECRDDLGESIEHFINCQEA